MTLFMTPRLNITDIFETLYRHDFGEHPAQDWFNGSGAFILATGCGNECANRKGIQPLYKKQTRLISSRGMR